VTIGPELITVVAYEPGIEVRDPQESLIILGNADRKSPRVSLLDRELFEPDVGNC
jgi:hypothetical protein